MQSWQIKALKMEGSALDVLAGFAHEHSLCFFLGAIYLLLALLGWVLGGALRREGGRRTSPVRPAIVIHVSESVSPPAEPLHDPFPPLRERPDYFDHDDYPLD